MIDFSSSTLEEEIECKESVLRALSQNRDTTLLKEAHVRYLMRCLTESLPEGYVSLDASRPWLFYWTLRSLTLLDALPAKKTELHRLCVKEIVNLQHPNGGFRGNHGQHAHLAATYASCAALTILEATDQIDVEMMHKFLQRLKVKETGAFMIQEYGGEDDLRSLYCAAAVAKLCRIDNPDELFDDLYVKRIADCQTFEGGLGAVPFAEAHGGYTYCGIAALALVNRLDAVNLGELLRYCQRMQCPETGGLRGRTNKLVDGCYSFWQAAAICIAAHGRSIKDRDGLLDWEKLQKYIYCAAQDDRKGGLRDKPGKPADLYHTCYCLSGLHIALDPSAISLDFLLLNIP